MVGLFVNCLDSLLLVRAWIGGSMVLWIADSSACLPATQTTSEMWEKLHNRRSSTLSSHCVPALRTRGRGRNVFCDSKTLKDALFQRCTGHACCEHSRWPLSRATGELYVPACVLAVPGAQSSENHALTSTVTVVHLLQLL